MTEPNWDKIQTTRLYDSLLRWLKVCAIGFFAAIAMAIIFYPLVRWSAEQAFVDLMNRRKMEQHEAGLKEDKIPHNVRQVIHILNYHYVTLEVFATDLKDQDNTLTQKQIVKQYKELLKAVEELQKEQETLLRRLVKKHKLKAVYLEGVTEKNHKDVMEVVAQLRYEEKREKDPLDPIDQLLNSMNKSDSLQLGVVGQLVVKGELEIILPAEDSKAFEAANPVQSDGTIVFDKKVIEAREDAIVRNLLRGDGVVVIVLGGDHDLSDNLKRLTKDVKYKRVAVPKYKELMEN